MTTAQIAAEKRRYEEELMKWLVWKTTPEQMALRAAKKE